MISGKCTKKRLLKECGCVVRSDTELAKLMKDREQWQLRIKIIVEDNYN